MIRTTAFFLALVGLTADALGASGYVHGRLTFYQHQGNFCPEDRDCTSAKYIEAEYHTNNPVKHAKVYLRNTDTGAFIGSSTTDGNGYYTIAWTSAAMPSSASIRWRGEHKDDRFVLKSPTGGTLNFSSTSFTLINGTTASSPQERGTINWGSATTPNPLVNAFDGAQRTWARAFQAANGLQGFNNVTIYAFSDTTPADCETSCALTTGNWIQLDEDAAYRFQARVAHEMGHIAAYRAAFYRPCYDDDSMDDFGGDPGWGSIEPEHQCMAFNEGLASYLGSVAIYSYPSPEPYYCNSEVACSTNFSLEDSSIADGCDTNEFRYPVSTMRYLWDIYDAGYENFFLVQDDMQRPFYEIIDTLSSYPSGSTNHRLNEPWNQDLNGTIDDPDGRSGEDFGYNFQGLTGLDEYSQFIMNCEP